MLNGLSLTPNEWLSWEILSWGVSGEAQWRLDMEAEQSSLSPGITFCELMCRRVGGLLSEGGTHLCSQMTKKGMAHVLLGLWNELCPCIRAWCGGRSKRGEAETPHLCVENRDQTSREAGAEKRKFLPFPLRQKQPPGHSSVLQQRKMGSLYGAKMRQICWDPSRVAWHLMSF